MSAKELRAKSAEELQKELIGLRREQFNLRMSQATGQGAKPDQFSKVRRNIARLKMVMGEQRRTGQGAAAQPVQAAASTEVKAKAKAPAKAKAKAAVKAKGESKGKKA
jgi:large subunit ribosomal protein L29